jgi:hypothetical protein
MPQEEEKRCREEERRKSLRALSRREFAIGSMSILGAVSAAEASVAAGARAAPSLSAAARSLNLTINKWNYEVQIEPEWTLRDILRDQLGVLSIEDACAGDWKCCSVVVDGKPILFCKRSPTV